MKSDLEISGNCAHKTIYENREYYGMVLGALIFRTLIVTVLLIPFLLYMGALMIEAVKIRSIVGVISVISFAVLAIIILYYLVIYRWTYKDNFLKTPKRVIVDGKTVCIETPRNTYKIDLDNVEMLGRAPHWRIKMKDGTTYEFYGVHHTITDPILATWKKVKKRNSEFTLK